MPSNRRGLLMADFMLPLIVVAALVLAATTIAVIEYSDRLAPVAERWEWLVSLILVVAMTNTAVDAWSRDEIFDALLFAGLVAMTGWPLLGYVREWLTVARKCWG
jgi:hypothetical protein